MFTWEVCDSGGAGTGCGIDGRHAVHVADRVEEFHQPLVPGWSAEWQLEQVAGYLSLRSLSATGSMLVLGVQGHREGIDTHGK